MPFTPYHFGPSGFLGLVFKRWLDFPAFVLANVIIDVEVLFSIERITGPMTHWNFPHRVFHFHTLLVGGIVGILFGLSLFLFRRFFQKIMSLLRLSYKPTAFKMALGGLLGVWLHVFIDGIYHWDVQMFWPKQNYRSLWNIFSQPQVRYICLAFGFAAVILYLILRAVSSRKNHKNKPQQSDQA